MVQPSAKRPLTRLVYGGAVFRIESYVASNGAVPAEEKNGSINCRSQHSKSSPHCLCAWAIRARSGTNGSSST